MKKQLLYILFFFTSLGFSQVKVEADTTKIRIGEQFQFKISVDEVQNVILPKLALKGLEIVDSSKVDTLNNKLIRKYILTGFDSGAFYIPQQQIFIKNQAYLTDSLLINVATVAVDTTKIKKFPIKSIKNEPYVFDDYKNYFWWIIGFLTVLGIILYFVLKKKADLQEEEIIPALPPFEEAIEKFQQLDDKLLWQNNKVKQYYSELTEIVRGYIERELKVPALETTTDEIIDAMKNFNGSDSVNTSKETIQKLKELLQEADLVKFAKSKPLSSEIEEDRIDAENIVNSLKPKPIEEDDAVE
jgi:hypothetical protein